MEGYAAPEVQLNTPQYEAVCHEEGPLLILAGAGSGKTRVLTHRIAHLIADCGVAPWNILAITFTNKAAGEMRERVDRIVGSGAEQIWVSTFHSTCARILRRYIDRIGYDTHFAIYDTDDSRQVMKQVIKSLDLNPKVYKERGLLARISVAKNELVGPDRYEAWSDRPDAEVVGAAYRAYQRALAGNNALDFDDLLMKTVELFRRDPEVLESYQERFRYILIDEYQDTNTAQFEFVRLLADRYRNLCVVGDDDQSIYKFRGANIRNILNFEEAFPGARVIKLEQNYRSTQNILNAANAVIANNVGRKQKRLWSDHGSGAKVSFRQFETGFEEAEYVVGDIRRRVREEGRDYQSFAVLYRTNAQSRLFEEKMITANIPYKIVGGINFYARREIKDLLSYLRTIDNGMDDLACTRIINVPKRGIGQTTVARVAAVAAEQGIGFFETLERAGEIDGLGRSAAKLDSFVQMIRRYRAMAEYADVLALLDQIIEDTGYVKELEAEETPEADARIENIEELRAKVTDYQTHAENPSLSEFLQQVSLVADIDDVEEGSDYVLLMTLHAAKGLEFDCVYMTGMEDGVFPGYLSINADDESEMEEERRLCYVGITRARQTLALTAARQRMVRGEVNLMKTSRFIREIPRELVELDRETEYRTRREAQAEQRRAQEYGSAAYGARSYAGGTAGQFGGTSRSASQIGDVMGMGRKKKAPAFNLRDFKVQKADHLDYAEGDRVRHIKFGVGTVQAIKEGGRDYEVTVDFETVGVKKMFASFAKLQKI